MITSRITITIREKTILLPWKPLTLWRQDAVRLGFSLARPAGLWNMLTRISPINPKFGTSVRISAVRVLKLKSLFADPR